MNVSQRIEEIIKNKENREKGKVNLIPFYEHFPRLSKFIPGLFKQGIYKILSGTGVGKCFDKGTRIRMYDGSVKQVENINIGDLLMGPDSLPRKVLRLTKGEDELFKITQSHGNNYIVNSHHILSLKNKEGIIINKKITDDLKDLYGWNAKVNYSAKNLIINPYLLGLWLGDGNEANSGITTIDNTIIKYLKEYSIRNNLQFKSYSKKETKAVTIHLTDYKENAVLRRPVKIFKDGFSKNFKSISKALGYLNKNITSSNNVKAVINKKRTRYSHYWEDLNVNLQQGNGLRVKLKLLNLLNNKHIPQDYMLSSVDQRLDLLAGILDSDGTMTKQGLFSVTQKSKELSDSIYYLACSLGFKCRRVVRLGNCSNCKDFKVTDYYVVTINGDTSIIPTKLKRKQSVKIPNYKNTLKEITVESIGNGNYYGFEVDGDNLFLLEDYTVTHNSKLARYLSVIVPYEASKTYGFQFHTLFFALEESVEEFYDSMIIMMLKIHHNINIDRLTLNSYFEKALTDDMIKKIVSVKDYVDNIMKHVTVYDDIRNPTGIYKACEEFSKQHGTHHTKTIKIDGREREVYSHYVPNDDNMFVIAVTDHISLLESEYSNIKGKTLSETECMSLWNDTYCSRLSNKWGWITLNVQQTTMSSDDINHFKANKLEPELSDAGDNKRILRTDKVIFGLYDPSRYGLKRHAGVDLTKYPDSYRSLKLMKNRYGLANRNVPLFFEGASGRFSEI